MISPDHDVATGTITTINTDVYFATTLRVHDLGGFGWWPNNVSVDPTSLVVTTGGDVARVDLYETSSLLITGGEVGRVYLYEPATAFVCLTIAAYAWTIDGGAVTKNTPITGLSLLEKHTLAGQLFTGNTVSVDFYLSDAATTVQVTDFV